MAFRSHINPFRCWVQGQRRFSEVLDIFSKAADRQWHKQRLLGWSSFKTLPSTIRQSQIEARYHTQPPNLSRHPNYHFAETQESTRRRTWGHENCTLAGKDGAATSGVEFLIAEACPTALKLPKPNLPFGKHMLQSASP
ncbi:hypothetical protein L3X38_045489 [Prunus dulcis]|uniref:Uncharacterized protein n=1 Tax=Prunus dulcis TaxID=3755 RepID=A0AAD4UPU3_PRUDU|nr:hypothetical protein L3X38_045489 [Prunus dulcis]